MKKTNARSWSLVVRLLLSFVGSFIVLALVTNMALYYFLNRGLQTSRSSILQDRLGAVETLLKSPAHGLDELHRRVEVEWPLRSGEAVYVWIYDGDKHLMLNSPQAPVQLPDGMQQISRAFDNSIGMKGPVFVRVAIGQEQGQEFLERFRELSLITVILSLGFSFLLGFVIVIRGLRPLREAALAIAKIDSKNLHERLQLKDQPQELKPVTEAFNQTLDRLEESFSRLDRFSSDIAHELRTPMTNMMGEVEIALNRPRTEAEYKETLLSVFEECSRIHGIASSLLFLARTRDNSSAAGGEVISLSQEITSLVDFFELQALEKKIELKIDAESEKALKTEDLLIQGQRTLFQRALANLLSNAIQYTRDHGHINVHVSSSKESITISVTDDGIGISPEDLPKIFDRFYRVDPSRNPHSGGFGLGLAIVKSIVELHGGTITATSQLDRGTQFAIRWPRFQSETGPDSRIVESANLNFSL